MRRELILIGGGARSGKSVFALSLAKRLGARRAFIATAEARDGEMHDRIARHRLERGDEFETFEEPFALTRQLMRLETHDVVVVDCLTLWLSNLLCAGTEEADVRTRIGEFVAVVARRRMHTLVITNEVGMGIVPDTPLGRIFRDLAGIAHQWLSRESDRVYAGMLGTMMRLKPAPVVATSGEVDELAHEVDGA
jgi:adenosylcobinamide kinase/adenosylcobinamide-phosphate guanylyltransferase